MIARTMSRRWPLALVVSSLLISGAAILYRTWPRRDPMNAAGDRVTPGEPRFTDITQHAGIRFSYYRGETGEFWITETTGGGVALIDYDGDGWLDIYFVNGCKQPYDENDFSHTCQLVRNLADGCFVETTIPAGVGHNGYGQGATVGDFDNDGFDDLYVTCFGSNVFYHNNGDGTYREVAAESGADCMLWSTGAAFADFDRDGDLDLFVANYVDFDPATAPQCGDPHTGQRSYCGPNSFGPLPAVLFENQGDSRFADVSAESGINLPDGQARPESKGLGVQVGDFDDDGWLDIFVANDQTPSFLFHNEGGLKFREVGVTQGVALTGEGATTATMGIAYGDFDGDGRLDLFTTNFYLEGATLYQNLGERGFRDVTARAGLLSTTRSVLGWGTAFFDYDNDGWLDLFASNGHVQHDRSGLIPYAMPPQLFRNTGRGTFLDVAPQAAPYFRQRWNGRGTAFGDIDNDGDTDLVIVHHHQPAVLLRNDSPHTGHHVSLQPVGVRSDRNGLGIRVLVSFDDHSASETRTRSLMRELSVSGSYLSSNDKRLLVGLGEAREIDAIEVRWTSGERLRIVENGTSPRILREPIESERGTE